MGQATRLRQILDGPQQGPTSTPSPTPQDEPRATRLQRILSGPSSSTPREPVVPTSNVPRLSTILDQSARSAARVPLRAVSGLFRALRAPQQAVVTGPVLAATRAMRDGRSPTGREVFAGSREALREDLSFRDVAHEAGMTGPAATITGLVGDFVLDPLWMATPAKIAKVARLPELLQATGVPRLARAATHTRAGQAVGRAVVTDFGKPTAFIERAEQHHREVFSAVESAVDLGRRIARLQPQEQRLVRDYMIAGTDNGRQGVLAATRTAGLDDNAVGMLAHEAMTRDVELGQSLVDVGLMTESTFQQWAGKHLRREFTKHESPRAYIKKLAEKDPQAAAVMEQRLKQRSGFVGQTGTLRERLEFLRQRQDLPPETLRQLGEILEAAHPVAKGQALAGQAVATRRFLHDIDTRFAVPAETLRQRGASAGYQRVPHEKGYGPLAGKYVPDAIHRDVVQLAARPGTFDRLWRQGVGWWKYNKVVLNPSTHARNVMSNFILADLAGLAPFKVHRYVQGARSLAKQDRWYQEAKQAGTFLTDTFVGVEIPKLLDGAESFQRLQAGATGWLMRAGRAAKGALAKAGDAYQAEEQWFKMSFFIDQRMKGLAPKAAADAAETALFNYRRVPWLVDNLRRYGVVPFLTFPYKALPATAKAIAQRPAAISRYGHIVRAFEAPRAEQARERSALPEYMKDGWMRLPDTDAQGRVRYLNLEYILPWGDIGEAFSLSGFLGSGGQKSAFLSVPGLDLGAAVVTGIDPFTNQEITKRPGGWRRYLWDFAVPPLAGSSGRELVAAGQGRPVNVLSRRAEPRSLKQAALATFAGLRITPVDIDESRAYRLRDLALRHPGGARDDAAVDAITVDLRGGARGGVRGVRHPHSRNRRASGRDPRRRPSRRPRQVERDRRASSPSPTARLETLAHSPGGTTTAVRPDSLSGGAVSMTRCRHCGDGADS